MADIQVKHPGKFEAIIKQRCPRCRKGPLFIHPSYSLKFGAMYDNCPFCGLKYEIEPGFFWGAMYISYAFTVIIGIITGVCIHIFLNDPDVLIYLAGIGLVLLLLSPLLFRFSRTLMLHFFSAVHYDPNAEKNRQ